VATQRQSALDRRFKRRCARYFARLTVESGPFAGLRYPTDLAYGSALYPKLLGVYESELHPALSRFLSEHYENIVDVGFAEGYYLIGLAQRFPEALIWGFDLSPEAHRLCTQVSHANNISNSRLKLATDAGGPGLDAALQGRALVICDCEGFEAKLFTAATMDRWKASDIIVECHDFLEPGITATLTRLLASTHEVECVPTQDALLKIASLPAALQEQFSHAEQVQLVSEGRPAAQSWIVATSRAKAAVPTR
jgi:hypothetical protein